MEVALAIVLFPLGFLLLWCGVCWLISQISGWARLARDYACERPPSGGESFHMQSARFGIAGNYNNCLTFTAAPEGLYMRTMIFFRIGHRPLLIPWQDIKLERETKVLFWRAARLALGARNPVHASVPAKVWDARPASPVAPLPVARVIP